MNRERRLGNAASWPRGGEIAATRARTAAGGRVARFLVLLTALLGLATLAALLARHVWIADLAVHFRVQYAALALAASATLAVVRRPGWAALAAAICAANAAAALPVLRAGENVPADAASGGMPVRIVALNVFHRNGSYERVLDYLRRDACDAAVLMEVSPEWRAALRDLESQYPYQYFADGPLRRGVLLLSRRPIRQATAIELGPGAESAVRATLEVHGRPLILLGAHANWPLGRATSAARNRQLATLARLARTAPAPVVLVGDLNVTPFSPHFRSMLAASGLRPAAQGFGWQPTWPTFLPPAGIQIDHGLVSRDVAVRGFSRGPRVGSDHLPIVLDLAL